MAIQYNANDLLQSPTLMQEFVNETNELLGQLQIGVSGSGGGSSVTYSDTAPSNPSQGDQWFHTDDADLNLYVYETSTGAWIDTSPGGGGSGGGITVLDTDILIANPVEGGLYYIATVPYFRATLTNGNLIPAATGRDNDTLHFTSGTDIGLENTPFKTTSPNIAFVMADSEFSSGSRRNYTVRGTAKAGYFQNNNYIDTSPDTQAADIGKFAWVALGVGASNTVAVGDVVAYVNSTIGWRKVASSTDAEW